MNRQITLSQYRTIDLTILLVVQAISQFVLHYAATILYPDQLYVVSPIAIVVALVMMRWSGYAAIHAAVGGVLFALVAGGSWHHFLIYGLGNLFSMAALVMFKLFDKERIRKDSFLTLVFALATQGLMQLGRSAVAALLGYPAGICLGFITTDVLSILFTLVIVWSIRRVEGLFEDQKHYLLRTQSEHKS